METLKLAIVALILACTFQAASAQVRVGVRIGTPPPRRVVVVERPYHRHAYYHGYYGRPYYAHNYHHGYYRRHW
jgi:hypothetical protein